MHDTKLFETIVVCGVACDDARASSQVIHAMPLGTDHRTALLHQIDDQLLISIVTRLRVSA